MLKKLAAVALLAGLPFTSALALEFELQPVVTQDDFDAISEDIVATINYKALGPAEATGLLGASVGVFGTWMPVDDDGAWARATGDSIDALPLAGLSATKGLPLDIDVGAFYTTIPGGGASAWGVELRYALLAGSTVTPALAIRGAYSTVTGIDDFDVESKSLDISLSKGFGPLTPYVGGGRVWGETDPHGLGGLEKSDVEETRLFLGFRFGLGFLDFIPEVEKIGDNTGYSLKLGLSI